MSEHDPVRVTVWGENVHEQQEDAVRALYPQGMHAAIAAGVAARLGDGVSVRTATLQEPEHGLTQSVLDDTDVLTWWGHIAHDQVDDAVVDRVQAAVLGGMGLLALHSAHYSKVFRRLLGTSCSLRWRNDGERELVWTVDPAHPIAAGVPHPIVIDAHEMYGEHFDIPAPDELVFISSFAGGEVFRGGCCFRRGAGRIFYFSPGDQDYPIYHHPDVQRVIANAIEWAAPRPGIRRAVPGSPESPRGWFERGAHDRRARRRRPARRRHRPRMGRPAAPRRLRRPAGRGGRRLAGLEEPIREELARATRIEHRLARWKDLLDLDGLDAVSVSVPTFLHAPIAIAALERGIHVLSEKPIALDGPEADAMVQAARKADRVLDVAFNHRQRGDIQKLKALIDDGRLGRPYYAKAWWLRRTGIPTVGSWFTRAELAGGGPLVDIGVHVLDCSLFLLGDPEVVAVSASTYDLLATDGFGAEPRAPTRRARPTTTRFDVEDLASVFMRLDDGGTLLVEASWAAHRRDGDEFGITLYGTDGGAELIVDDYAPKGDLRVFTDDDGEAVADHACP